MIYLTNVIKLTASTCYVGTFVCFVPHAWALLMTVAQRGILFQVVLLNLCFPVVRIAQCLQNH